jgi:hypothetical protein
VAGGPDFRPALSWCSGDIARLILLTIRFSVSGRRQSSYGRVWASPTSRSRSASTLPRRATRTYFTSAQDLVRNLAMAHLEGRWGSKMRTYSGPSVLVPGVGVLGLRGRDTALREELDRSDLQSRLRRVGPGVCRSCRGIRDPRPAAAPRHRHQHGRNAKLIFRALLRCDGTGAGLYRHPDHRRRRRSPPPDGRRNV